MTDPSVPAASDPVSNLYHGHARLSPAGIVEASVSTEYADRLAYDLPGNVSVQQGWIDAVDDMGIPDGSWTELSVYRIHRGPDQNGFLSVDTRGSHAAVRLARRATGGSTVLSIWVNGQPLDPGPVTPEEADYVVMIGPAGSPSGTGHYGYEGLTFSWIDQDGNPID